MVLLGQPGKSLFQVPFRGSAMIRGQKADEDVFPFKCHLPLSGVLKNRVRETDRGSSVLHLDGTPFCLLGWLYASFFGRVLFASIFILSAYPELNEYGVGGGMAAKALGPKFDVFLKHVQSQVAVQLPDIQVKHLVAAAIALKGMGGILFIFGSSFGAYLLLLHQLITIPILYDFYNYDKEAKEFGQLFIKFTQNVALFGALLFFIGMKNSIPRRQSKKKAPKMKTV
ncbi:uncharacterized protein LOC121249520 [Juglans microcarpa x Juglans regia]|uniref:uncharacterized protein LOC121249520 n=1 Tax=Juglans microcarpa x Juglans regia TaxID=2249226 RepID=UPI001B7F76A6|nr:uncharacterized protein LOC121249520 [Juglans microcarpa x Juglans regia]